MKLKLDLHPIYSDSQRIEQALQNIIAEAVEKRASEVEIIPGKGSGAHTTRSYWWARRAQ